MRGTGNVNVCPTPLAGMELGIGDVRLQPRHLQGGQARGRWWGRVSVGALTHPPSGQARAKQVAEEGI